MGRSLVTTGRIVMVRSIGISEINQNRGKKVYDVKKHNVRATQHIVDSNCKQSFPLTNVSLLFATVHLT